MKLQEYKHKTVVYTHNLVLSAKEYDHLLNAANKSCSPDKPYNVIKSITLNLGRDDESWIAKPLMLNVVRGTGDKITR